MKQIKHPFLTILLIASIVCTPTLHAGIYKVVVLISPDDSQTVRLYFDNHALGTIKDNKEQFAIIERAINTFKSNNERIDIFVESDVFFRPLSISPEENEWVFVGEEHETPEDIQAITQKVIQAGLGRERTHPSDIEDIWNYRSSLFYPIPYLIGKQITSNQNSVHVISIEARNIIFDLKRFIEYGTMPTLVRGSLENVFDDTLKQIQTTHKTIDFMAAPPEKSLTFPKPPSTSQSNIKKTQKKKQTGLVQASPTEKKFTHPQKRFSPEYEQKIKDTYDDIEKKLKKFTNTFKTWLAGIFDRNYTAWKCDFIQNKIHTDISKKHEQLTTNIKETLTEYEELLKKVTKNPLIYNLESKNITKLSNSLEQLMNERSQLEQTFTTQYNACFDSGQQDIIKSNLKNSIIDLYIEYNALKHILESTSNNVAVFVGGLHAEKIQTWLEELNYTIIYNQGYETSEEKTFPQRENPSVEYGIEIDYPSAAKTLINKALQETLVTGKIPHKIKPIPEELCTIENLMDALFIKDVSTINAILKQKPELINQKNASDQTIIEAAVILNNNEILKKIAVLFTPETMNSILTKIDDIFAHTTEKSMIEALLTIGADPLQKKDANAFNAFQARPEFKNILLTGRLQYLANYWHKKIPDLRKQLPTLSPAEKNALQKEMNTTIRDMLELLAKTQSAFD